jgi:hypothetical protein
MLNAAILVGQLSTPASARAGANGSRLLDDEDFVDDQARQKDRS